MSFWIVSSSLSRMLPGLALPSVVRQAPDHKALQKSTTLVVAGQPLFTPPIAQEYFEPGVNTKLTRRKTPKTNFTLPSDMPKYPMGFVPTNKASGAETGEEPPLIVVKESKPADLMDVFARIEAEEKAVAMQPKYGVDMGTRVVREYQAAKSEALLDKRVDSLLREGYTEKEAVSAVEVVRMEEAIKKAKLPPRPVPVEEAIQEALGVATLSVAPRREMQVQTDVSVEKGKVLYARKARRTPEEIALERALEDMESETASVAQPPQKLTIPQIFAMQMKGKK